jgi:hypothetical protein
MTAAATEMPKIIEAFEAGTGIYTVPETAFYSKLHPNTIRAWFFRQNTAPRFRRPSLTFEGAPLLSFTDFVEALYVSELRSRFHISFHRIRKAIGTARDLKGVEHPFAHPDFRTVIIGKTIHIQERESPEVLTSLAPDSGQTSDKVILEDFINSLEFDECDVAKLYVAYSAEGERVIAARDYNFGIPMMESCGYTAQTLFDAAAVEGGAQKAADAYGVEFTTVKVAIDYLNSLQRAA